MVSYQERKKLEELRNKHNEMMWQYYYENVEPLEIDTEDGHEVEKCIDQLYNIGKEIGLDNDDISIIVNDDIILENFSKIEDINNWYGFIDEEKEYEEKYKKFYKIAFANLKKLADMYGNEFVKTIWRQYKKEY